MAGSEGKLSKKVALCQRELEQLVVLLDAAPPAVAQHKAAISAFLEGEFAGLHAALAKSDGGMNGHAPVETKPVAKAAPAKASNREDGLKALHDHISTAKVLAFRSAPSRIYRDLACVITDLQALMSRRRGRRRPGAAVAVHRRRAARARPASRAG
jgi:hypothetical protein